LIGGVYWTICKVCLPSIVLNEGWKEPKGGYVRPEGQGTVLEEDSVGDRKASLSPTIVKNVTKEVVTSKAEYVVQYISQRLREAMY
jgi:hypothetical protein